MADYKVTVDVDVNDSKLGELQKTINALDGKKGIKININTGDANKRINALKKKIESLSNIKVNIGGLGSVSTSSGTVGGFVKNVKNQVESASAAFSRLQSIQKEIKNARQNLSILDAKTDSQAIDNLTKRINRLIVEYDKLYAAKSKSLSTSEISALNKEYSANIAPIKQTAEAAKELLSVQKQIGNLEVKIKGLDDNTDANQIRKLNSQLSTLKSTYNELRTSLNGQLSSGQLKSLNDEITSTENKLAQLEAKLADVKTKKATDISGNIGNFGIENEADKIEKSFNRIIEKTKTTQAAMERFKSVRDGLKSANQDFLNADTEEKKAAAIDNLIAKYDEYKASLSAVKNQIELNTRAEKENAAADKLKSDKNTFSLGISNWLKNNSAAAEDFSGRLRKLQAELKTCDSVRFNGIKSEFKQITTEAELAGKTGLTFGDRFKQQFSKLSSYFSAASVIMAAIQVGKEAIQNVIDIDTQMTELYRVTDLSTTQYSQLYDKLTVSAKEYGVALTDLISATADWSRAGFDADTAAGLAEITSIYQHIADLDYDTSVENLLTAYKGFESELKNTYGDDANSAAMHIADIYNEIDNNYATTAADIGEAVKRSASALNLAGNSLEETAG